MKTNKNNVWTFDNLVCKRNGRKFGDVVEQTEEQIKVFVTRRGHESYNQILTFQIVANAKNKD
jgi:hypothetical protein